MEINKKVPVVQSKEVLINAKPIKVWGILTDIERWPDWNSRIKDAHTLGQPSVGTYFKWKNSGSKIKSKIHTYDQNRTLGWTGKTFGAIATHNWYLTPIENGTKVNTKESIEGWMIGLMKKKMNKILEEDMAYWLEKLKIKCEE